MGIRPRSRYDVSHADQTAMAREVKGNLLTRLIIPKGPCTQIVYTSAPMYLNRDYFKAKVYTIWVHGPFANAS